MAPPLPLAALLPYLSDVMQKAKPREAQGTCWPRHHWLQQHPPFHLHHCLAHLCTLTCPSCTCCGFTRDITLYLKISSVDIRRMYDPGSNSVGSNGGSDTLSHAMLWPTERVQKSMCPAQTAPCPNLSCIIPTPLLHNIPSQLKQQK